MLLIRCLLICSCLCLLSGSLSAFAAPLRVALLLEGVAGDNGWNDNLIAGLKQAEAKGLCTGEVISAMTEETQEAAFERAATTFDLTLVASTAYQSLLRSRAGDFPNARFGSIDEAAPAPNIMSCIFADGEVAFLAGAAAAIMARDGNVPGIRGGDELAWISGQNTPVSQNMRNAFAMGAHSVDPALRITDKVLGSYNDPALGHAVALQLYAAGVDIIACAAGGSGLGCLKAARESGRYAFGADGNQDNLAPGQVIFSMIKRGDMAVLRLVEAAATGNFRGRAVINLDLKSGGVDISDMSPLKQKLGKNLPAALERRLKELRYELEQGRIDVTTRKKGQLCDCL